MVAINPDGPLNVSLRRYADREARVWVQRWKRDHPITIALTLEEYELICASKPIVDEQVRIAPKAETPTGNVLDLGAAVQIEREAGAR